MLPIGLQYEVVGEPEGGGKVVILTLTVTKIRYQFYVLGCGGPEGNTLSSENDGYDVLSIPISTLRIGLMAVFALKVRGSRKSTYQVVGVYVHEDGKVTLSLSVRNSDGYVLNMDRGICLSAVRPDGQETFYKNCGSDQEGEEVDIDSLNESLSEFIRGSFDSWEEVES